MKIPLSSPLLGLDGKEIQTPDGKSFALRDAIQQALMGVLESDRNMTAADKLRAFSLALKSQSQEMDATAEDVAFIKDRIGRAFAPLIVGRAFEQLDPKSESAAK